MISIKDRKILGQIFSHYDYVMTTAQLSKEKLYYRDVQRMLEAGLIERIKRGYYHWAAGSGKGDVVIISRLLSFCISGSKAYPSVSKTGGFFIPKIKKGRFNSL